MDEIKNNVPYVDESVFTITAEAYAKEAAEKMRDNKLGALIVVKGGENWGMLTETDLARKIVADGLDPKQTKVKFIMNKPIVTIDGNLTMMAAFVKMGKHGIRHIAVTEGETIMGILSVKNFVTYYTNKYGKKK